MQRGEIYFADLGPALGDELGNIRPVVIISSDVFNSHPIVVIVVIGTDSSAVSPTSGVFVPAIESGAPADVVFFPNQIRSLDPSRLTPASLGSIPTNRLGQLIVRVKTYLDIP